jgi:hypothetical protein
MNSAGRTLNLARILIISELRASRSKNGRRRLWERPSFVLAADALAFSLSWFVTFEILSIIPANFAYLIGPLSQQVLAFVPIFALVMILLAGIMFELNASSRFASSDLVNWLPLSKTDYVTASAVSTSYVYSPFLLIAEGFALALSAHSGIFIAWIASSLLAIVSLFTGGLFIEILRATINRVYSVMSKKSGRGTLVVRLVLIILVIVALQVVVNPNLLFSLMGNVVGSLDASFFIPLVWPSLTVQGVIAGDFARAASFGALTGVFAVFVFLVSVITRSRYWSPAQAAVSFGSKSGYVPKVSRLGILGISNREASVISKDFRAYFRKKELVSVLALPFVFAAVLGIQKISLSSSADTVPWLVAWFSGFAAIFISATSIGVEGKTILNLYLVPLQTKELVRSKAFTSLILSLIGALTMSLVSGLLFGMNLLLFSKLLIMSGLVASQSVLLGLCFATRNSDFIERPRPRYISTSGMVKAIIVGFVALGATAAPILLFQSQLYISVLLSVVLFSIISFFAYRYALKGAKTLLSELLT